MRSKSTFVIAPIVFVAIFVFYPFFLDHLYPGLIPKGDLQDLYAPINAFFSGLAFLGLLGAILLQREELSLQREELKLTRTELERTAVAQENSEKALLKQANALQQTTEQAFTPYLVIGNDSNGSLHIKNIGKGIAKDIIFGAGTSIVSGNSLSNISTLGADEERNLLLWDEKVEGYWSANKEELDKAITFFYSDLLDNKYRASLVRRQDFREYVVVTQEKVATE